MVLREVYEALESHSPLVALESTIITHGMPYPHNLRTALEVESIIRANGATPATIGIIDGIVYVGMKHSQLEQLALKGKYPFGFLDSIRTVSAFCLLFRVKLICLRFVL
ncbi:Pseudouridine-5'-phosphate glycosidase 2 [Blomia tropicalis]|nr:Pseudouridine-5'-phosphate glycosidase 2 [Blomia tropicalis]